MTPLQDLYLHVLETATGLHPERRARVLRGLADIIGDETFARDLIARAEASEALQRADGQLPFAFLRTLERKTSEDATGNGSAHS